MFEMKVRCWNISLGQQFPIYQESLSPSWLLHPQKRALGAPPRALQFNDAGRSGMAQ